ncbi:hypothetical protein [Frigoriflavimonas asaccharolytica]|uniref:Uncharacterized protein n=1 Tax=Frigoriflavimonas asaccharolytica TaxID=2735899 RepID=A0A8J8GDX9_9FLAO|nr:hypothetical protein [Frigoriflavimonas asaccharolytica]NRS94057.1 hypothetical protein [Frigoriflavimonas asaccharolytica]
MIKKAETSKKVQFTDAIYHYETIISKKISENHIINKSFVREVKIFYLGKKEKNQLFRLLTLKFKFSDEDNSDVIFLKKLSYLWDDIEVMVNSENVIINIENLLKLRLRWLKTSNSLSLSHTGNAVEKYFVKISNLLENSDKVCEFLNSYKMFGLLFNGQYGGYDDYNIKKRMFSEQNIALTESLKIIKKEHKRELKTEILEKNLTEIENYNGIFFYENDHLIEAFVDYKMKDKQIKYSLLWIG